MTIEDTWGGDITTAAIAHLAHTAARTLPFFGTDFNSYVTVALPTAHRSARQGRLAASREPGLGVRPMMNILGEPLAIFS